MALLVSAVRIDDAAALKAERFGRFEVGALVAVEVHQHRMVGESRGAASAAEGAANAGGRIRGILPGREIAVEMREERIARNE